MARYQAERTASPAGHGIMRPAGLYGGLLLFTAMLLLPPPDGLAIEGWRVAALGVLMASWWITEAVPIPATALLPLPLVPALDVGTIDQAAAPFSNPIIFLFLGGFCIAQAMQRWGLHRRIALNVIRFTGTRPTALIAGFMIAAAFLSMWISNTAVAVMMLPIGLSVVELARNTSLGNGASPTLDVSAADLRAGDAGADRTIAAGLDSAAPERNFGLGLMLGIAYATSIGGVATLIGTPPNALLAGFMRETYGVDVSFSEWLIIGLPLALVMLPVAWLLLTRFVFPPGIRTLPGGEALIGRELARLGPRSRGENVVATIFTLTAVAWISRPMLAGIVPSLSDAGIAIGAAILLFMIPVDRRTGTFTLDWETAKRLPWDVLILFGGGLSLAAAISRSGLAEWIGASLAVLHALPLLALVAVVCAVILFMTELTSNTATAAAFLPVAGGLALALGLDPLTLAVPVALSASCAFMLPVATPPNAVVYGSGYVRIADMAKAGLVLNVLFATAIPFLVIALIGFIG